MNKLLFINQKSNFDFFIFIPILFLIIIGIFGIFSVSMRIDDKYEFLIRKHLVFCLIGLIIIISFSKLSIKKSNFNFHKPFYSRYYTIRSDYFFLSRNKRS